jgi:acetyl-CoA carboxylase biotin carboxyl carrier protein
VAKNKKVAQKQPKKSSFAESEQIEGILRLMREHRIAHFEWENADVRFCLKTETEVALQAVPLAAAPRQMASPSAAQQAPAAVAPAAGQASMPSNQKQILSPFVGTFYRAASPTAEPYVKEGQSVKSGDVLCIIEAMKLMNEIEAEHSGRIVSILAENGQPVEFGEPLFVIET